jgi:hypothetical protein
VKQIVSSILSHPIPSNLIAPILAGVVPRFLFLEIERCRRTLLYALCQRASNCRRGVEYAAGRTTCAVQLVAVQIVAAKKWPRKTGAIRRKY